jgi:hypothetical protein
MELQFDDNWQLACICGNIMPLKDSEVPKEARLNRRQYELEPLQSPQDAHFISHYINKFPRFNKIMEE